MTSDQSAPDRRSGRLGTPAIGIRRVLTDRALGSVAVLRQCYERGIDLPVEERERAGSGVALIWEDEVC